MTTAPTRIFFSYARSDAALVLRLSRELRAGGHSVWVDQIDIPKGARWDEEVERALKGCTCLLVVLSPTAVGSSNVMDEVSYALGEKKTVIPLIYQPTELPFRLRRLQHLDFTGDFDEAYRQLVEALPASAAPTAAVGAADAVAPVAPAAAQPVPAPASAPLPPPAPVPVPAAQSKQPMLLALGAVGVVAVALLAYRSLPERAPGPDAAAVPPAPGPVAAPVPTPAPAPAPAVAVALPSSTPAAAQPICTEQQVSDFVGRLLAAHGSADVATLLPFYAERVDFFGQRGVDRNFIAKDKTAYFKRWPQVQMAKQGPLEIRQLPGGETCAVSYPMRYQVSSPARGDSKSGIVSMELVLGWVNGKLQIAYHNERPFAASGQ